MQNYIAFQIALDVRLGGQCIQGLNTINIIVFRIHNSLDSILLDA